MSTDHRPPAPPTTTDGPLRLRLHEPGELVAAVPHLLGFRPADSLVVIAVHGPGDGAERSPTRGPGRRRLGVVARADLPPPDDVAAVVGACAQRVVPTGPEEVTAVVVAADQGDGEPPRVDVADAVREVFTDRGVAVPSRLWVPHIAAGVRWRCYPPCDCRGTVAGIDDSPLAAAATWLGHVTYGSRDEMAASLEPESPHPRLRALVDAARQAAVLDRELGGPAAARRDLAAVATARREVAAGRVLGDVELARVAVALTDPTVRDTVLGWSVDDDEELVSSAEQLWTLLVRALPAPEVAEPAVLLACALLVRGGSALVGVALERARRADPTHRLTGLLRALLASGAGPETVREVVRDAAAESAARLRAG
ncbi:DUF4192 domain-containing protein [Actinomycetospora cinnamomea]|uniref:DUF4192 domain-containing protein n=1 Tax=Actinomycetospora cinnamomea TaxID=663609 RepID=UPI001402DBA5|nr:DUF4192 domain-containing protein [Actinomycetospora cinnamomea]